MAEAVRDLDDITLVDLYAEYAEFQIDIHCEQQRLLEHDVIFFNIPCIGIRHRRS